MDRRKRVDERHIEGEVLKFTYVAKEHGENEGQPLTIGYGFIAAETLSS
jgi:hypothetical protein